MATEVRCGGKDGDSFIANSSRNLKVKEVLKLANISQSYERKILLVF